MTENTNTIDQVLNLTSDIICAHINNSDVNMDEVPELIEKVYAALAAVHDQGRGRPGRPTPAIAIKKSVTPDYIICLEDGKKLKMLKRHLKAVYGMSIQEYRERWGLPADYPTVAPNYAKQRSRLAKTIGLGTSRKKAS